MRVLFLQNYWHEQIGVMYIAGLLKARGHHCDVFIGDEKNALKYLKNSPCDLIAFSCTTGRHLWALKTARAIKKSLKNSPKIIMGGPHPTFYPEIINDPSVDIICRGEGEYAMLELLDKMKEGGDLRSIKNLWVKGKDGVYKNELRPLIEDLDGLPAPDRSIYYKYKFLRGNPVKNFLAIRGCPYNCSYCFNHSLKKLYSGKGAYVRQRSAENVIREIKYVKDVYKLKIVRFQDDILAIDKDWLKEFCGIYKKEINLPFICYIMPNLTDEDVVKNLKEAGCIVVSFGVESGNEDYRMKVLKKPTRDSDIIKAAGLLKKYKIHFYTQNMFGLPGERLEGAFETIGLNRKIGSPDVCGNIFQPFPGTEIADYCINKGLLKKEDMEKTGSSYEKSVLRQRDISLSVNLCHLFYLIIKFPWCLPVAAKLIKFSPNRVYLLIYQVFDAFSFAKRTRMGAVRLLSEIMRHYKYHLDRV